MSHESYSVVIDIIGEQEEGVDPLDNDEDHAG